MRPEKAIWTGSNRGNRISRAFAAGVIAGAAEGRKRTLVTIDGPCASGKTTLARELSQALGAFVLHTDDFVIPHAQKTPGRLSVPGGNCDADRLTGEALAPWKEGKRAFFRIYDFRADRLLPEEEIPDVSLLILEGSYANLPQIRACADLCLFMDTPEEERMARLKERETPGSLRGFMERWIPLENAYFEAYGLPDEKCLIVG